MSGFAGVMGWKDVDEKLIRREELFLSLDFLEGYDEELAEMNRGQRGEALHPDPLPHQLPRGGKVPLRHALPPAGGLLHRLEPVGSEAFVRRLLGAEEAHPRLGYETLQEAEGLR